MIHIEIGAMPPLLRSIVRSALGMDGDLVVVEPMAIEGYGTRSAESEADVLIVCSDREPDGCIPVRQLASKDSPAIIAIDSEGAAATILRVTAETTRIAAAADLCNAVRRAAGRRSRMAN